MSVVEAILVYRPHGYGAHEAVPVGRTDDPEVLCLLRDRVLEHAAAEARFWSDVDPGIGALRAAEAERLTRVLGFLLPDAA